MSSKKSYNELKWRLSQLPSEKETTLIRTSIVDEYNNSINLLENEIKEDLGRFKVHDRDRYDHEDYYVLPVRTQMGSLIGYLEDRFGYDNDSLKASGGSSTITILNNNTFAVTINNTIQQLIEKAGSEEEKTKLIELEKELQMPQKNWSRIKEILAWTVNFSEKLFFELLPIILKHYNVN